MHTLVGHTHAKVPTLRTCWYKYTPKGEPQNQLRNLLSPRLDELAPSRAGEGGARD